MTMLLSSMAAAGGLSDKTLVAVSTVIAAVISGVVAYATQQSAARAAVRNQTIESRTDIEREAFERAKGYYTDTLDRQKREIDDLESDVARLKPLADEVPILRLRVATLEQTLAGTQTELDAAKKALALRFPDEP